MQPAPVPTFLYEVAVAGGQPSYVFAALEGAPLHASFPAEYEGIFHLARQVYVPDAHTAEESEAFMRELATRDAALPRQLGPDAFATLSDECGALVPAPVLAHLTPTGAFAILQWSATARAAGVSVTDARISPTHDAVSRRQMAGLPITALFSDAELRASVHEVDPIALDTLRAALAHATEWQAEIAAAIAVYRSGDEAAVVHDVATPGLDRAEAITRAQYTRALDAHAADIIADMRQGNVLVVLPVEAVLRGHGLLARVREAGLPVTRISVSHVE